MKYLKFNSSHPVEDFDGNALYNRAGEPQMIPFEVFLKSVILVDDRWGKSVKKLNLLMDLRDQVKTLSKSETEGDKILELPLDAWYLCCEIAEEPQVGFAVKYASALLKHVKDLMNASNDKSLHSGAPQITINN